MFLRLSVCGLTFCWKCYEMLYSLSWRMRAIVAAVPQNETVVSAASLHHLYGRTERIFKTITCFLPPIRDIQSLMLF